MRRISWGGGLAIGIGILGMVGGCTDRLPTLSDPDRFPGGEIPVTLEHVIEAGEFLLGSSVYDGVTDWSDLSTYVVARDFDASLNAHVLADFASFPDTVTIGSQKYGEFTYLEGQVTSIVPNELAASENDITFALWTVTQPWDTASVSWSNAVENDEGSTAWAEPGGTRGSLVGLVPWTRSDTSAVADSLIWNVSGELIRQLASREVAGLMVTLENVDARIEMAHLELHAEIHPAVDSDTVVTRTILPTSQTFIYTPEAPEAPDVLRVGGLHSDRSILRIDLDQTLPGCASRECADLELDEVVLNRVELVLDPVLVTRGFRPTAPVRLRVRRVLELELGDRAPLGPLVDNGGIIVDAAVFRELEPVVVPLNQAIALALADEETELGIALLVEPEASNFGVSWFERTPRLRFIYTLPQIPQLP